MASDLMLFQVSSIVALIGMGLGWRGVMTRYSGFYDLPTAWSMMFWGILIGGFYGNLGDSFLLIPAYESGGFPSLNFIISLLLAVTVHLILRRKKIRMGGSQPTTGWALGLSIGGMLGMFAIYRILQINGFSIPVAGSVALIAIASPRSHALIFANHGYRMLLGQRWRAVIHTFFWSTMTIASIYSAIFNPIIWIFVVPVILLAEKQAHDWVWAAIPKPARRRLRRIWADAARERTKEEE